MPQADRQQKSALHSPQAGFSLLETMISLVILLAVGAVVMSGMVQMMQTQGTISNRTEMHASVRSATELLEQEIGQAGKLAPPVTAAGAPCLMTLGTAVTASADLPVTLQVTINSTNCATPVASMFNNEWLVIDAGMDASGAPRQESVAITCGNPCGNPVIATFTNSHLVGAPVSVQGAFSAGIIPPGTTCGGVACGSDGTHLKLFGDVNGDGNMVYVEYNCQPGTPAAPGALYRNQLAWTAAVKPPVDATMILLNNLLTNPPDPNGNAFPCFNYQTKAVGVAPGTDTYVTDVEVTLTEQTQSEDPTTKQFQTETKALLNVSPRNVFNAWQADTLGTSDRVQPYTGPTRQNGQLPLSIAILAP